MPLIRLALRVCLLAGAMVISDAADAQSVSEPGWQKFIAGLERVVTGVG